MRLFGLPTLVERESYYHFCRN